MNVMLDLETFGVRPGCIILSIGAVDFSINGLGKEFYRIITIESCISASLVKEKDTEDWWMKQSVEARGIFTAKEAIQLSDALWEFRSFLNVNDRIWGNGADFDLPILAAAYHSINEKTPWKPFNGRCYRTLKNLAQAVPFHRLGTYHNALDDAKSQALHAIEICKSLGVSP